MINEYIMELVEEMTNPTEMALNDTVEDTIEAEDDIMFGTAEDDDDVIQFIDDGGLGYENPVNFSMDVQDAIDDDEE